MSKLPKPKWVKSKLISPAHLIDEEGEIDLIDALKEQELLTQARTVLALSKIDITESDTKWAKQVLEKIEADSEQEINL